MSPSWLPLPLQAATVARRPGLNEDWVTLLERNRALWACANVLCTSARKVRSSGADGAPPVPGAPDKQDNSVNEVEWRLVVSADMRVEGSKVGQDLVPAVGEPR